MKRPDKEEMNQLRKKFPTGSRVMLIKMEDFQAPPPGTLGTVLGIDDIGSLIVRWDNGSGLHVLYGIDECINLSVE